jgi:hypothetical protein
MLSNYISAGSVEKSICLTVAYSSNGVDNHRLLKGKVKKSKTPKKSKAPKANLAPLAPKPSPVLCPVPMACPIIPTYVTPAACDYPVCYSNMALLANAINTSLTNDGDSFKATVCPGLHIWDASTKVEVKVNANLELFCCGGKNDCIIDGNSPVVTRTNNVFYFHGTIFLNIQGITFQNFFCSTCVGTLLTNSAIPAVVIFKHNLVRNVTALDVSAWFTFVYNLSLVTT